MMPGAQLPPALPPLPHRPGPARRRRNAGSIATLLLGVLIVLGFVGYVWQAARTGQTTAAPGDGPPAEPATTATPSTAGSSAPTATTAHPSTTRVPPLPQKVARLADNPLYGAGRLPEVDCALPRLAPDPPAQLAFHRAAVTCLDRAWLPVLAAAGLPTGTPEVQVPTEAYTTPCGDKSPTENANYCEGVIYMPPRYFAEVEGAEPSRVSVYLGVLAHEYGHHVQELAGVMDAAWAQRYELGVESPGGLEVSRRNELGASCFGGMFLAGSAGRGSISRELADQIVRDQGRRGDLPDSGPPDHGTPRNNGAWYAEGFHRNDAAACNTWVAAPASVS